MLFYPIWNSKSSENCCIDRGKGALSPVVPSYFPAYPSSFPKSRLSGPALLRFDTLHYRHYSGYNGHSSKIGYSNPKKPLSYREHLTKTV
jgi:hypothetical protein